MEDNGYCVAPAIQNSRLLFTIIVHFMFPLLLLSNRNQNAFLIFRAAFEAIETIIPRPYGRWWVFSVFILLRNAAYTFTRKLLYPGDIEGRLDYQLALYIMAGLLIVVDGVAGLYWMSEASVHRLPTPARHHKKIPYDQPNCSCCYENKLAAKCPGCSFAMCQTCAVAWMMHQQRCSCPQCRLTIYLFQDNGEAYLYHVQKTTYQLAQRRERQRARKQALEASQRKLEMKIAWQLEQEAGQRQLNKKRKKRGSKQKRARLRKRQAKLNNQ